jgi:hypothetical protein
MLAARPAAMQGGRPGAVAKPQKGADRSLMHASRLEQS